MKQPLVSICIPCNGRLEIVRNTLMSIYESNREVPLDLFEVVISDNDPQQSVKSLIPAFDYPNLHYFYSECEGFMNSYYVLTYAKGKFLKLHNSQFLFKEGVLSRLIQEILNNIDEKPLVFYSNGMIYSGKTESFNSFDRFFYRLSYWPSWSNGFAIWKDDFDKITNISLNKLFPHTSLFVTQYAKSTFIINDCYWFDSQRVYGRGGHNKFKAFTIDFPSLVDECYTNKLISTTTKKHVLNGIMYKFLPSLLFNKYIARIENFEIEGYRENIKKYFHKGAYWITWIMVLFVPLEYIHKRVFLYFTSKNRSSTLNIEDCSRGGE